MVELDNIKTELATYEEPLKEIRASLSLDDKARRVEELEREMEAPGFWDDAERSQKYTKELSSLKDTIALVNGLDQQFEDIKTLLEMGYEENDPEMVPEIQAEFDEFREKLENLRISTLLSGEYDKNNAILRLNAGAGGTESCDWASMLYRMYSRWAEKKGFSVDVLEYFSKNDINFLIWNKIYIKRLFTFC